MVTICLWESVGNPYLYIFIRRGIALSTGSVQCKYYLRSTVLFEQWKDWKGYKAQFFCLSKWYRSVSGTQTVRICNGWATCINCEMNMKWEDGDQPHRREEWERRFNWTTTAPPNPFVVPNPSFQKVLLLARKFQFNFGGSSLSLFLPHHQHIPSIYPEYYFCHPEYQHPRWCTRTGNRWRSQNKDYFWGKGQEVDVRWQCLMVVVLLWFR